MYHMYMLHTGTSKPLTARVVIYCYASCMSCMLCPSPAVEVEDCLNVSEDQFLLPLQGTGNGGAVYLLLVALWKVRGEGRGERNKVRSEEWVVRVKVWWAVSYINTHVQAGHILLLGVQNLSDDMPEGCTGVHSEILQAAKEHTKKCSRVYCLLDPLLCLLSLLWVHPLSLTL